MKTLICNCNRTMPLDVVSLAKALAPRTSTTTTPNPTSAATPPSTTSHATPDGLDFVHTTLCRREAPAFQRAAKSGEPLLVACTQESRLFLELNEQTVGAPGLQERPIRFVNIRETAGWSKDAKQATPKIAALIAAAQLPTPDPVTSVSYKSAGRCLVIGDGPAADRATAMLGTGLNVSMLIQGNRGGIAQRHDVAVHRGTLDTLTGWLGTFEATWTSVNPIDLDLCTRCNACIAVCPEAAIDFSYTIDMSRCKSHRDCVVACEAAGAIDFDRAPQTTTETFDMVLDLREQPAFAQHAPPQGYVHVASDPTRLADAVLKMRDWVGEFEKPKFFQYKAKLCAHSRNEQIGCTACIDVCSALAIRSDATLKGKLGGKVRSFTAATPLAGGQGGGIVVNPHLCVGCGACTTVCPSGALAYALPNTIDQGRTLRTMLQTYQRAGGRDAVLLIHSEGAGARVVEALGRAAQTDKSIHGLPARVMPLSVWHTASVGLDLWLAALALGAHQVWVLMTDEEAPAYRQALAEQMAVGQAIMSGLGYQGSHLRTLEMAAVAVGATGPSAADLAALDRALRDAPAQGVAKAAALAPQADKRATLDLALDHLVAMAPDGARWTVSDTQDAIALPEQGSPFGSLAIDTAKCTLCLSCVGACPEAALADNAEKPQLRFIEKNCVQCGLCVTTCPEDALRLQPRLWLANEGKARKQMRVLNEAEPYPCIKCGKPFGTQRAVEAMIEKIGNHAAFAGQGAQRLRMCSDCRVVDMFSNPNEVRITDL